MTMNGQAALTLVHYWSQILEGLRNATNSDKCAAPWIGKNPASEDDNGN
jgi:hypothetical protein